jgi:hypothetical protein
VDSPTQLARRPPSPSVPKAAPPDEDDDARTLIAQPRPPTGPGPAIAVGPGGALGLAQTLASEMGDIELPRAGPGDRPGAKADALGPPRTATPAPTSGLDIGSEPTDADDRERPPPDAGKTTGDRLGLGGTLPLDPAELERVLAAGPAPAGPPPARASLISLSEVSAAEASSPGAGPSALAAPSPSVAAPAPAKKGLSVAMAMVLGALIGAIVVGAIVVALVSMR